MKGKNRGIKLKLTPEQKLIQQNLRLAEMVAHWSRKKALADRKFSSYSRQWARLHARNREFFIRLEMGIEDGSARGVNLHDEANSPAA